MTKNTFVAEVTFKQHLSNTEAELTKALLIKKRLSRLYEHQNLVYCQWLTQAVSLILMKLSFYQVFQLNGNVGFT